MDIYDSKRDYFENIVTLTYEGKMQPHVLKQYMKKNYNCEHFEIISDREETTFKGMTNPAMCDVKMLNCLQRVVGQSEQLPCKHEHIESSDGCDKCMDCGERNY